MKLEKSIFKKNILWVIAVFWVGGTFVHAQTASVSKKPVEIFAGGKKFDTLDDYKLEKVRDFLRRALNIQDDQALDDLLQKIQKENPLIDLAALNEEELKTIVDKIKKEEAALAPEKSQDNDLTEMEEMLKEYQDEHGEDPSVILDPDKVKTIMITPGRE